MKKFMSEDFLLTNDVAKELYHNYAKKMPIFDFHCHLNPQEIAENKNYKNISEVWLGGDHYKWRAMRTNGVSECIITGKDTEGSLKFRKWAETVPYTLGNPLYHWTHLELQRYFGIEEILSAKTQERIYNQCNKLLEKNEFTPKEIIKRSNVVGLCTTDDPIDTLEYHKIIREDKTFTVKVLPTFRPDKVINIEKNEFIEWLEKLEKVVNKEIKSYRQLLEALEERIDFFHKNGCRSSDHGLDTIVYEELSLEELDDIFLKGTRKENLTQRELDGYKGQLLLWLGREYDKRSWVMQLHIGALRNNSIRMLKALGPDTGFDSIGDTNYAQKLAQILNKLDETDQLPKTILYCLNPRDNYMLGTMIGCFQGGGISGKIQFGSGWWFSDQKDGMEEQMKALANLGLLSKFVGMLTDSRSFLSYTRHEYFRRILCNLIGKWVENGEYPNDKEFLGKIVEDICYNNAINYFSFEN